jgi:hypothetical protein
MQKLLLCIGAICAVTHGIPQDGISQDRSFERVADALPADLYIDEGTTIPLSADTQAYSLSGGGTIDLKGHSLSIIPLEEGSEIPVQKIPNSANQ